jgi:hypothetical protein
VSGSSSKTETQSSQATNVSELNLQDTGGITVADNKGGTNLTYNSVTTDSGAIAGIVQTANQAFKTAGMLSSDVNAAAVNLGGQALDTGAQVANHGLDNAAAAYESGLSFGTNIVNTTAQLLQDSADREAALTNNALAGYQSIAQQNSASQSTQIQKIAIYAIAAAVAVVVLPGLFKS